MSTANQTHCYHSLAEINRALAISRRRKIQFSLITFLVLFWAAVAIQPDFLALPSSFYHWSGAVMIFPTYCITFGVLSTLDSSCRKVVLSKVFKFLLALTLCVGVAAYWIGVYFHYYTGIGVFCVLFGIFISSFALMLLGQIFDGKLTFPDLEKYRKENRKDNNGFNFTSEDTFLDPMHNLRLENIHNRK